MIRDGNVKIYNLTENSGIYTSNVYLVTGSWNTLDDSNTLIDVGRDFSILERIFELPTGVGKKQVDKVVITHNHYDHTSMLPNVKKVFNPRVYAYSTSLEGVDEILGNNDCIRIGDRMFTVIHTPGHSSDSICLFCEEDGVLFCGDAPLMIKSAESTYEESFIRVMERLCRYNVNAIYFGHGKPMLSVCNNALHDSLKNIRKGILARGIK